MEQNLATCIHQIKMKSVSISAVLLLSSCVGLTHQQVLAVSHNGNTMSNSIWSRLFKGGGQSATKTASRQESHTRWPDMSNVPEKNIRLTNVWEEQFFGDIYIGSPPQKLTVVFDTGSSSIVMNKNYDYTKSMTARRSDYGFSADYGSGGARGMTVHDSVSAGGFELPDAVVAVPTSTSAYFKKFRFDGIFGLSLHHTMGSSSDTFGLICKANPGMTCVFAFYLTHHHNTKGSLLTMGGYDSTKVATGAKWQYAQVSTMQTYSDMFSFWSANLNGFHVDGQQPSTACTGWEKCSAIVDSGTSYLGVPYNHWDKIMNAVTAGKKCRFTTGERQMQCTEADRTKYPTLTFRFAPNVLFELKGEEYVECYKTWAPYRCHIRIKNHAKIPGNNFFVFGDWFIRKYYTVFDHEAKQMGFVCATGVKGCQIPAAL